MQFSFILVHPVVPENVGFCARAMKTMGYSDLRIVGSPLHEDTEARNTGYGSHDILEQVQVFSTLKGAVADCNLVVGTTAKERVKRYDYLTPEKLDSVLTGKPSDTHVAMVFGSETNGLDKADIDCCDLLTTIPLETGYPSLNLAQAVLVYAYELAKTSESIEDERAVPDGLLQTAKSDIGTLLDDLNYDRHPIKRQRIMDRLMLLGQEDLELVMDLVGSLRRRDQV